MNTLNATETQPLSVTLYPVAATAAAPCLQQYEWLSSHVGRTVMFRHRCGTLCIGSFCPTCHMEAPTR